MMVARLVSVERGRERGSRVMRVGGKEGCGGGNVGHSSGPPVVPSVRRQEGGGGGGEGAQKEGERERSDGTE